MEHPISLLPRLSEKTYALSSDRVYTVSVRRNVNKQTLKRAIEDQFSVKVVSINTTNMKGKAKRSLSAKGRQLATGRSSDFKKAYVTLAEGSSLPFFAAIEEDEKQAEKVQTELAKQQEKDAKKQSKPKRRGLRTKKEEAEKD